MIMKSLLVLLVTFALVGCGASKTVETQVEVDPVVQEVAYLLSLMEKALKVESAVGYRLLAMMVIG